MTNRQHPAVGIDLGTTFSAVAILNDGGRPETIRNREGELTTPSAVFLDRSQTIVGVEALEAGLHEPDRMAQFVKRELGQTCFGKQINGRSFPLEVLQGLILRKLKADAERTIGPIDQAVITVPAYFNEPCRKATQDACALAGLRVLDMVNEPTAAAITYGVRCGFLSEVGESEKKERVLVYDLGGGSFDVTVIEIDGTHYRTIATAGDVNLGGMDWDRRIADLIAVAFQQQHGFDPREAAGGLQELMRKGNQVKHALTQRDSCIVAFAQQGRRLRMELTKQEFADATSDLVERTLVATRTVMDEAQIGFEDLTQLILVGGSTRMPMIRDELQHLSGLQVNLSLSPDEAVCHGAAIYAGVLLKHQGEHLTSVSVQNVNSHDLGVLAVDPKTGDPRRAVMIGRNTALPANHEIRFRTFRDDQPNVKIQIVEGGDDSGDGATTIGKCYVHPLPPKTPKGTEVDVQFQYSHDGRLSVRAKLPTLEQSVQTTIKRASGLRPDQLQSWQKLLEDGGFALPDSNGYQENREQCVGSGADGNDGRQIDSDRNLKASTKQIVVSTPVPEFPSKQDDAGDDSALAAFLKTAASGCGDGASAGGGPPSLTIKSADPVDLSSPPRKKLKRAIHAAGNGQSHTTSDWKSRRKRFQ